MSLQKSTTPCPRCLVQGQISMLANQPGRFETFCITQSGIGGPHTWPDREVLNMELAAAKRQFPQHYHGPQAPTPNPEAATRAIVIDPETRQAIEQIVKHPISGGGDIKGILFEAVTTRDDLEKEVIKMRATVGTMRKHVTSSAAPGGQIGPNQFVVTIPEWAESSVADFAQHEGKTPAEWINETLNDYLEQFCSQRA